MKRCVWWVVVFLSLLVMGCPKIHEPWVQNPDRLKSERTRPAKAAQELRHRILLVQVDR